MSLRNHVKLGRLYRWWYLLLHFVVIGLLGLNQLCAQVVSGQILDKSNMEPLIGATIQIGLDGTISDANGDFSLRVDSTSLIIRISYLGYKTWEQQIEISGDSLQLKIELEPMIQLLDITTVTASKYEKPLGESTVSLDVLPGKLLDNINATSVDESLDKLPGVQIVGGQANIRGGSGYSYGAGSRVMLLVNDLPILTVDAGFPNWDDLPVENVFQVEVLKGASSALYGSSALNGIINVRTAYPTTEPVTRISTFYNMILPPQDREKQWWSSSPASFGIQGSHAQRFGQLDLVLGGYYLNRKLAYQNGDLSYGRLNFNTLYRITDRFTIGLNGNLNRGQGLNYFYWQDNLSGAFKGAEGTENESDRFRYNLDPVIKWFSQAGASHKILGRYYNVNNQSSNQRSNQSQSQYTEYQFNQSWDSTGLNLTIGGLFNSGKVNAALYGDTTFTSSNYAFYAQLEKKLGKKLNISLGGRLEGYRLNTPDQIGNILVDADLNQEVKPVFRVGLNYKLAKYSFLRGSWGQGFRFPTIAERFIRTTLGPTLISPNPNLVSETGWSAEVGWKQGVALGGWQGYLDLAAFLSEYFEMMEFLFTSLNSGFQSINVGDTRISGLEVSLIGQSYLGDYPLNLLIGYTYLNPVFQNFKQEDQQRSSVDYNILKYRSKHQFKFDAQIEIQRFQFGVSTQYVSKMEAIDAIFELVIPGLQDFRLQEKGYTLVNARLNYTVKKWTLSFLINNLLNQEYSVRPGLLEDPINLTIKAGVLF